MCMTYEEIASARSVSIKRPDSKIVEEVTTPDLDSNESLDDNDLSISQPESFNKLNNKNGEN
jgi:hypothetical protein